MGSIGARTTTVISKYSGDEINIQSALLAWGRNATSIKKASQGVEYDPNKALGNIGLNDNARADVIKNYIKGNTVKTPIYRGIKDLDSNTFAQYTKVGNTVDFKGLESWSSSKQTASGRGTNGITFIKESNTSNARSVDNVTGTGEKEVIALNVKGKITRVEKGKYTTYVYIR